MFCEYCEIFLDKLNFIEYDVQNIVLWYTDGVSAYLDKEKVVDRIMKATIYDVATEAGLSIATVSRVINKTGAVNPETEKRVLKAIEKLHYEPSMMAKGLAANETHIISLIISGMLATANEPQYAIRFINGVLSAATESDYEVLIKSSSIVPSAAEHGGFSDQTDGAIFISVSGNENKIRERVDRSKPVVYAGLQQAFDENGGHNIYGGYHLYRREALDILYDRGYRNVVLIEARENARDQMTRDIHERILREAEEKYAEDNFKCRTITVETGKEKFEKLLSSEDCPDALFVYSIENFVEVSEILSKHNLKVKKDIGVIATSHSKRGGTEFSPEISCIYLDAYEMGRRAARLLFKQIKGTTEHIERDIAYRFIDRDSLSTQMQTN